jgi:hypothetical protein
MGTRTDTFCRSRENQPGSKHFRATLQSCYLDLLQIFMGLKFKAEVSIGEILTAIAIFISLTGVLVNWQKDRQLEIKKQSNHIRDLNVQAFSKFISWRDLNLHFYDRIEVTIKDVASSFASKKDIILARDIFWKQANQTRNDISYEALQKELTTFHFILLSNGLDRDSTFVRTITYIGTVLEINHKYFLRETQQIILSEAVSNATQTAILGDKLRAINEEYRRKTKQLFKSESAKLQAQLRSIITKTDREIFYQE